MQGNDRGTHGIVWNWVQSAREMQGNEGKYQENICEVQSARKERNAGNAKLTWEWVQCARESRGMMGNTRGTPRERMVVGT